MACVIEIPNPFNLTDVRKHFLESRITIREWLELRYPGFEEFETPTICVRNGNPVLRKDWNSPIEKNDVVSFVGVGPTEVFTVIAVIITVILAVLSFVIPLPKIPGQTPASDPVFSVKGKNNSIRLGEPIEVVYGKNRIYPAFASRPYYQYENNDQYQYSLFCLGHGYFEIETIQISDTDIADYEEVSYEVVEPGEQTTLFPINVYTSPEAGGQTLYAPNETEYVDPGWVGPFPSNPSATQTNKIQIDLVLPNGLYTMNKDGGLVAQGVLVEAEARLINDAGAPLGAYFELTSPFPIAITAATTTPIRRTFSADVAAGRYEVRLRRTDTKYLIASAGHTVEWDGMRAYLTDQPDFGNVTLLAVKARATANLNERTQTAFNVIATRKIPVYDSGGFTDPQTTRSIVWAFVDVFRNTVYGGRVDDDLFDMDALVALDATYTERGEYFDWIFRDPITVWEAARTIARAGRAVPLLVGSLITMRRDEPLEIPVAMFTQDNIIKGSFQWNVVLWEPNDYDSIAITYIEPSTGYKEEQVIASLPGDTSDNPKDVTLPGVTDRDHAYHEGMYMLASECYLRENITFETGMEGHIPIYGDLIAIAHDVPRWGQSGIVVNAVLETDGSYRIWLSEPVDYTPSETESGDYVIMFRGRGTDLFGPFTVEFTSDSQQVRAYIPDSTDAGTEGFDFLLSGKTEPMIYLLGLNGNITKYAKVTKVEPQGDERIRITAVNDEAVIHSFDSLSAPALSTPSVSIEVPDLPEISSLTLTQLNQPFQIILASWTAAFGAQYYITQTSEDGTTWTNRGTTTRTSLQFQAHPGNLWFRVAAVNNGQGPWVTEQIVVGLIPALDLVTPWDDLDWGIEWSLASSELSYRVDVYDNSATNPVLKHTANLALDVREFAYDYAQAVLDGNLTRHMLVEVTPIYVDGDGAAASLELENDIPAAPGSPSSVIDSMETGDVINYRLSWTLPADLDLIRLVVWVSNVQGFDPEVDTPFYEQVLTSPTETGGLDTEVLVPIELDSFGAHDAHYYRIAVFDVWGNEIETNITDEQVILAFG